jgi:hypothetical protein
VQVVKENAKTKTSGKTACAGSNFGEAEGVSMSLDKESPPTAPDN